MIRARRILFVFLFLLTATGSIFAQQSQPTQMASLRPNPELHWQRTSPTSRQTDGPVLYQLVFTPGTTGTIAKFDTNTRHLVNSDITDVNSVVNIGGFMINAGTGVVTFVNGQIFPGTGGGTVTSVSNTDNLLTITSPSTTPVINLNTVSTDARYVLKAGDTMSGPLVFSNNQVFPGTWGLHGNAGMNCFTSPCSTFLGTTDSSAFEIEVKGVRALRIEPAQFGTSNVIGGFPGNQVVSNVFGATIAGGGSTALGGGVNTVTGALGTVSGGQGNTAADRGTVGGGSSNSAGSFATIAGGSRSNASGTGGFIGGGDSNTASGMNSVVGGGGANSASNGNATVAGGSNNVASGAGSAVAGGGGNTASNTNSAVAGGAFNKASGIGSIVAGGQNNTADGDYSFAAGQFATANGHLNAFVWGDGSGVLTTQATVDNQFVAHAIGGFQFIAGNDGSGRPDATKTVTLAANSGIITFASGQTFTGSQISSTNGMNVDTSNSDNGTFGSGGPNAANLLLFGAGNTGEGIGSQRTSNGGGNGNNQSGLDFYTSYTNRMSIDNNGNVNVGGLSINSSGVVTFAGGQAFPGTGTVTSVSNSDGFLSVTSPTTTPVINLNTTNTDARYVNKAGDTMTGALALPANGLTVGGIQLAAAGGNVNMSGDLNIGGRISLGIYINTETPTTAIWDEKCTNASDIAISGGGFVTGAGVFLRESRPTTTVPPGTIGAAPGNAWRVTCSNATNDVNCSQAYVVCVSHVKQ